MLQTVNPEPLKIIKAIESPSVRAFLESKGRRSKKTAEGYGCALNSFRRFLEPENYDLETILEPLHNGSIDIYMLLDDYLRSLPNAGQTPAVWLAGVKQYLAYHDIFVIKEKFKNRVTVPVARIEELHPLEREDIRRILLGISSQRLRTYLICKASAGFRATEGLALHTRDITFLEQGARLYMKAQYSKNKLPREVYVTDEAAVELKRWIKMTEPKPDAFVFASEDGATPEGMYDGFRYHFQKFMGQINMRSKRVGQHRHEITLHSLRAFAETMIEDNSSANFADYILGHKKSTYYRHKEPERRALYFGKCGEALTFFDYEKMENKVRRLERENDTLSSRLQDEIAKLNAAVANLQNHQ